MPVDQLFIYQVEYPYGSPILADGEIFIPDDNGNVFPISQIEVSEEVKKDLGYIENNFLPLSFLLEGQRSGRPRELNEKQRIMLSDIVESGPVAYGFISGVWSAKMIAQIILEEFDVAYHPGHVCRILDELDFSLQRPKKLLAKTDPAKQNKWRRQIYPNIKKKHKI